MRHRRAVMRSLMARARKALGRPSAPVTPIRGIAEAEIRARLAEHDAKLCALFAVMDQACEAAGLPGTGTDAGKPRLRIVDGEAESA